MAFNSRKYTRTVIIVTWIALLVILFTRNMFIPEIMNRESTLIEKAKQEKFYGIWFQNKRIGYVAERLQPNEKGFALDQEAYLILNVLETSQPINMELQAQLSDSLVLQDFNFKFASPFYTMAASGKATGNTVHFELDTGESKIKDSLTLSGPPLLAINDRSYLLKELKEPGDRIKIPSFDPVSLNARESLITYYGKESILINNRVKSLHHFSEATGSMRTNFWLDDEGKIVKEESPAGFYFIAEPEFRAKDIAEPGSDLLAAVAITPSGPKPGNNISAIRYKILFPNDLSLDIIGGRQSLDGNILTIAHEQFPSSANNSSSNCSFPKSLIASRYVQSENPEIQQLAKKIVGSVTDPAKQTRLLASWIYENLEKRPVLGLPDALTTLHNLQGDCNEHASLFAALARSLKIPTTIATGVTLQNNAFYYHAWNQVCLNGTWFTLDTTTNQVPADLYHIRFGIGDLEEQLKIGGLLGKLQIEFLPQE